MIIISISRPRISDRQALINAACSNWVNVQNTTGIVRVLYAACLHAVFTNDIRSVRLHSPLLLADFHIVLMPISVTMSAAMETCVCAMQLPSVSRTGVLPATHAPAPMQLVRFRSLVAVLAAQR